MVNLMLFVVLYVIHKGISQKYILSVYVVCPFIVNPKPKPLTDNFVLFSIYPRRPYFGHLMLLQFCNSVPSQSRRSSTIFLQMLPFQCLFVHLHLVSASTSSGHHRNVIYGITNWPRIIFRSPYFKSVNPNFCTIWC